MFEEAARTTAATTAINSQKEDTLQQIMQKQQLSNQAIVDLAKVYKKGENDDKLDLARQRVESFKEFSKEINNDIGELACKIEDIKKKIFRRSGSDSLIPNIDKYQDLFIIIDRSKVESQLKTDLLHWESKLKE